MNSTMHKTTSLLCLGLILVAAGAVTAAAEPVVIAHSSVPGDAVDASTLQGIYLGKTSTWSDGSPVAPATIKGGDVTDAFLKSYVKKSSSQFASFWKKAVFTGTGTPPKEFGSDAEMVAWVAATPGAVGYVSAGAATDGCKVFAVN